MHRVLKKSPVQLLKHASRCVKCGRCLTVCPVYREIQRETAAARGKLALIEAIAAGDNTLSEEKIKDILSYCLLCGACAENCPNLVPADHIIQTAREVFISPRNPSVFCQTFLSHVLPFPARMEKLLRAARTLQPLLLKQVPPESGLHWRFSAQEKTRRSIPRLTNEPFLRAYQHVRRPDNPAALLFVGCVANHIFPSVAESALALSQQLHLYLHVPPEQGCCGLMAFGAGETSVARMIARSTIEAFETEGTVPIIAACSSCSSHLKQYGELFDDDPWKQRAAEFASRVQDLSEFLIQARFLQAVHLQSRAPGRVTFHDPCHLRRMQGIMSPPRELLRAINGTSFVETGQENLCCGSGGSFNLSHYDVSLNIFRKRLQPIREAEVDTVVTSCMGCLLQFLDGCYQAGTAVSVQHLADVLKQALV